MSDSIRFWLDDRIETVSGLDPDLSVLDWLRYVAGRTGSKEGCAEGDCGACTVLVGDLVSGAMQWRAINACIAFMPMLDGKALMTVESLGDSGHLNPVQQAMVDLNGSQCGFCTPGFVMSLCGRAMGACGTKDVPVVDVLAGNLCRCTGYGPILDAAYSHAPFEHADSAIIQALEGLRRDLPLVIAKDGRRWTSLKSSDQLAEHLLRAPFASLIAGATDVGLWLTKKYQVLPEIFYIGDIEDLRQIEETPLGVRFGAGVRYVEACDVLERLHPELSGLVRRIGAVQVRNSGTLGGNIANGSPIGDMPPAFIALGAILTLRCGPNRREIPLEAFFLSYGKKDLRPSEFVESIFVPRPEPSDLIRIVKLSKRFDSDISAVCAAIALKIDEGIIRQARVAFGGMAGIPCRAPQCEAELQGHPFSPSTLENAAQALSHDFQPLSDVRGTADYRLKVAGNILRRLCLETKEDGLLGVEPIHV